VYEHMAAGRLRAVVDTAVSFDRAIDAFRRFDAPDLFGKIVLRDPPE
jgi:NADPH:quinone reductase-like Zn-dependent oxidoreductase